MRTILVLVVAAMTIPLEIRAGEIETLIQRIKNTSNTSAGISSEEQEVAKELQAIGPEAIAYLLPLLSHPNKNVREAAGYALRDMKGLKEEHLEVLTRSFQGDGGWLPSAIANIGTPKAISFLVDELVRQRETQNQITWAVAKVLGEKAVPQLLQIYQTNFGWDERLTQTMDEVFHDMDSRAESAIDPLRQIMNDGNASTAKRIHAVRALGAIGLTAERVAPDLEKMRKNGDPDLSEAAKSAILRMGTAAAAPILAEYLQKANDRDCTLILREIASLHQRGRSAGATVFPLLKSENWETRQCAIRTLGYIGYEEAAGDLIRLLDCVEDWGVVMSAAEALGRMEIKAATPKLTEVSQEHWYPPVREAANVALRAIRERVHPKSRYAESNFALEYFDFWNAGENLEKLESTDFVRLHLPIHEVDKAIPRTVLANPEGTPDVPGGNCAIKVSDGYLVGHNRGEWGGEIVFVDFAGKARTLVHENTEAIHQTKSGILATTGLAHMMMNSGVIYKLDKGVTGEWQARPWRALPGAPAFSILLKDGRLLVNCYSGIVTVSPHGDMRILTRKEALKQLAPPR